MSWPWIVIPDTHGQVGKVESYVQFFTKNGMLQDHQLIFLGDYLDRGPDAKALVDLAITLQAQGHVFLCGNHEYTLVRALENDVNWIRRWTLNYERGTCLSYGFNPKGMLPQEKISALRSVIPQNHIEFFKNLPWFYETENEFFIHAGLDPIESFEVQLASLAEKWSAHWQIDKRGPKQLFSAELAALRSNPLTKTLITGHFAVLNPIFAYKRVMLDGGVSVGGPLFAWDGKILWQV